jgi:type III restriction enzyme
VLKNYQKQAIKILDEFCNTLHVKSIAQSFRDITKTQYLEVEDFDNPYVCLRVPTGGGKTLIATKSLRILVNEYLNKDYHLVFWLAPSDKIVTQTLEALKDKRHFYRKILDKEFDNINVMSIKESFRQKFGPKNELVIIVGTIQSFRTSSKDGRKFYDENANYYELLKAYDVKPSLENVMKHFKPIIILDEAHKSSTGLSLERLLDLNPSFILEFTATPVTKTNVAKKIYASNILFSVTASELKKESMIKLPIMLKTIDDTKLILKESIEKRNYLEQLAKIEEMKTDKYIRPINLIRADENRGEDSVTYDKIKKILIEDFGIDENEIAIQTGNLKEIDGIDLLSPTCKIRYIITVDALKEGWDCPFAYILSVVSNMESKTAIEQLIGRVLRMPYIEEKDRKELGYSFVYVKSENFEGVAASIGDTLVKSGFEDFEAKISIKTANDTNEYIGELGGLFGEDMFEHRQIEVEEIDLELLNKASIEPYVNYNTQTKKLTIIKMPTASKREAFIKNIQNIVPIEKHEEIVEIVKQLESLNSEKLGFIEDIELPKLLIIDDDEIVEFEESLILEYIDISEKELIQNSILTLDEFDINLNEHIGKIDITKNNKVSVKEITEQNNLFDAGENSYVSDVINEYKVNIDEKKNIAKLSVNISKIIRDENSDILKILNSNELNTFVSLVIMNLIDKRENIDFYMCESHKYQLKRAILKKLNKILKESKNVSFKRFLKDDNFATNEENIFRFTPNSYRPNEDSRSTNLKKHHYKYADKFDSNEEYECAKYIDNMPEVTTWIKNISQDSKNSFWLQTSTDKFYPDFIIKLSNGKIIVAEYKGEHLKNDDTKEKEIIGKAWSSQAENCVFLMLYKGDYKEKLKNSLHANN